MRADEALAWRQNVYLLNWDSVWLHAPLTKPAPLRRRDKSLLQLQKHHGHLSQELAGLLDQLR